MGEDGRHSRKAVADRSEEFGERVLGTLLDRAHQVAPQLIAPLVAEEVARIGGRDVWILLQDYGQRMLAALGQGPGGRQARADRRLRCRPGLSQRDRGGGGGPDGVRMYLPLLESSDQVGMLALTLDAVDEDDRRLLRRLAGLVADTLIAKNS